MALHKSCISLAGMHLSVSHSPPPALLSQSSDSELTLEDIDHFTELNLTGVTIDLEWMIASMCRRLVALVINEDHGWGTSGITAAGLARFLQRCPFLEQFCIALDTRLGQPRDMSPSPVRVGSLHKPMERRINQDNVKRSKFPDPDPLMSNASCFELLVCSEPEYWINKPNLLHCKHLMFLLEHEIRYALSRLCKKLPRTPFQELASRARQDVPLVLRQLPHFVLVKANLSECQCHPKRLEDARRSITHVAGIRELEWLARTQTFGGWRRPFIQATVHAVDGLLVVCAARRPVDAVVDKTVEEKLHYDDPAEDSIRAAR
ncbi:hypothetical protein OG21DRAFT_1524408 [Imleria badia]|nr:hypothetical protein OG21DRAFT_1524408 [Imleria badia]